MRPIDADALVLELCKRNNKLQPRFFRSDIIVKEVLAETLECIVAVPTLDCAPVIRCKDCMWWKTSGCWFHQPGKCVEREPNDFCSDGQRRSTDA